MSQSISAHKIYARMNLLEKPSLLESIKGILFVFSLSHIVEKSRKLKRFREGSEFLSHQWYLKGSHSIHNFCCKISLKL